MYNDDTELLFPLRVLPALEDMRSAEWAKIVDEVQSESKNSLSAFAFELMMVKLNSCGVCDADSFRAMRGCSQCSKQTIRRFKGSDADLTRLFQQAKQDIKNYLESNHLRYSNKNG
jgi:hypothetical protein